MIELKRKQVWDPLVRIFHWLLVACFAIAYLGEGERLALHLLVGSVVLGLVLFRLAWGVIGTRYARFTEFAHPPRQVIRHLHDLVRRKPGEHIGHTPAGGMMIFVLLAGLLGLGLSGAILYGLESSAPFYASLLSGLDIETILFIEGLHAWLANILVLLVLLHVGGVLVESLLQRQNLIRAMVTGYKTYREEN